MHGPTNGRQLIAQYRDGYAAVAEALLKITPEELDVKPGAGPVVGARDRPSSGRQRDDGRRPAAAAARRGSPDDPGLRSGRVRAAAALRSAARGVARTVPAARGSRPRSSGSLDARANGCARARTRKPGRTASKRWLKIYADHAHKHARQIRDRAGRAHAKRSTSAHLQSS